MNAPNAFKVLCVLLVVAALPNAMRNASALEAGPPKGAKVYQVAIHNFAFEPKNLAVPSGAYVVWTNRDEEPHVVTSAGALFPSSGALDTGDSHTVMFSKPGTYTYYCSIHPMMVGTITVH
ncbi:MAG TPA: plastocyanin/azurin family copper-binding protein [Dyella sp.]|uniref:cupredoxin domain-containing protein n=1 Tax=Dyella sp. TaxID=1869338 RepID=UPI002CF3F202|nr:plastocyanin/azurin family copper-binding protein [Dyella sp.]HTV85738.1 plastocyanin/azurin family copper-binding protein [Dyella sp.]